MSHLNFDKDFLTSKVIVKQMGIFLRIAPHEPMVFSQLQEILHRRGVLDYDPELIQALIQQKADGIWHKIGNYTADESYASRLIVQVSPDQMSVMATMSEPQHGARSLTYEEVVDAMALEGITTGILFQNISQMVNEEIFNQAFKVAKGQPAIHEKKAGFYCSFLALENKRFHFSSTHPIDVDIKNGIFNVQQGDIVAEKINAMKGQKGVNVFGKILDFQKEDLPYFVSSLKKGNHVMLQGSNFIAEKSGYVFIKNDAIHVSDVLVINGDMNQEMGNLDFAGDIKIKGNVTSPLSIRAYKNIQIDGKVEKAFLSARGDVSVQLGVIDGIIQSHGQVHSLFLDRSKVMAKKDIVIQNYIHHSYLETQGKVITLSADGQIIGGNVFAKQGVDSEIIGSPHQEETSIVVGKDPFLQKNFYHILEAEKNLQVNLTQLEQRVQNFQNQTPEQEKKQQEYKKLLEQLHKFQHQLMEMIHKKTDVQNLLNKENKESYILARQKMYPGVKLQVNQTTLMNQELIMAHKLTSNGKELVLDPFYQSAKF